MECSICLNQLTEEPSSLVPADVNITDNYKQSENEKFFESSVLCVTSCGHVYHRRCLISWLKSKRRRTCPFCRKKVRQEKLYPVYLTPQQEKYLAYGSPSSEVTLPPSGNRKSSCLLPVLRRLFSMSSTSSDQEIPQQLQVAVTINCVPPGGGGPNVIVGNVEAPTRTTTTMSTSNQRTCSCSCPHHLHHR